MMNVQRAKEIAQSPEMIDVTYLGEKIYIQHVDEKNETVTVFPLDNRENEMVVNVAHLKEE